MSCKLMRGLRPRTGIYIVNKSTLVDDADVAIWTKACATQIIEHVAPAYGLEPVRVEFLTDRSHAPAGAWVLALMDDSDQAGDLGWHTEDDAGRVYGRVFVRPCLQYGVPVSTTASHEIVETFVDPDVNVWKDTGRGYKVAYEACDPVEGDSYLIDGVAVSDFVTPAWYATGTPGPPTRTLHWLDNGHVLAPFALAPGGYCVRQHPDGSEEQIFGSLANHGYIAAKRHELARTARRLGGSTEERTSR